MGWTSSGRSSTSLDHQFTCCRLPSADARALVRQQETVRRAGSTRASARNRPRLSLRTQGTSRIGQLLTESQTCWLMTSSQQLSPGGPAAVLGSFTPREKAPDPSTGSKRVWVACDLHVKTLQQDCCKRLGCSNLYRNTPDSYQFQDGYKYILLPVIYQNTSGAPPDSCKCSLRYVIIIT